jgi:membrane protease YdiL (CAAX protease family)
MSVKAEKLWLFILLTFTLSWLIAGLFLYLGGKWGTLNAIIVATAFMFMPMISAIFVHKFYKEPLKKPLGVSFNLNRWLLAAWLLPPIIAFATIGVSLLIPGVSLDLEMVEFFERYEKVMSFEQLEQMKAQMSDFPIHIFWIALIQGLFAGVTINAVAGFGEELGWRGFLLKELIYMGFWKASIIIGFIWGVWHAPLILQGHNYPQHPMEGVFMMIIFCIILSPIFSYIRLKAKSVIAAAIIHGSLNATAGLPIMIIKGGNDLIIGVTGAAGFIVLLIINLLIFIFDYSIKEWKKLN